MSIQIKINNIKGIVPYKIFFCDENYDNCELFNENFRKTNFEYEYDGILPVVGVKIVTSDNKVFKEIFSKKKEIFVDCPLEIATQTINPTAGQSNGSAVVTISNCYGTPEIMWSDGQTSLIASNLSGGTYTVTVTDPDKIGCSKSETVNLYEELYIQVTKCELFSLSEFICETDYRIDWGFGFESYNSTNTSLSKSYDNLFTGTIIIQVNSLSKIKSIIEDIIIGESILTTSEISKLSGLNTLQTIKMEVEGLYSELPQSLLDLNIVGKITGNSNELPVNLTALTLSTKTFLSGDTSGLPRNLVVFKTKNNQLDGDTINLPLFLTGLTISDFTTIYGSTFGLPQNLVSLELKGFNTIGGTTGGLPSNLKNCEIWGYNQITGSILTLPQQLESLVIAGNNTLNGNLSDLPNTLNKKLYFGGANTITGTISQIPNKVSEIYLAGSGTTNNEIVSGNINDLSTGVTFCVIYGNNEVTGQLSNTTSHSRLLYLDIRGNNTISGDTADLPIGIQNLIVLGQNNLNVFSSGTTRTFWQSMSQIIIVPVIPFDENSINNFLTSLVELDVKPTLPGTITLKGYLDLDNTKTKENYDTLVGRGFVINISPNI